MIIRDELPGDADAIDLITTEAFLDHPFSIQTEAAIIRELRAVGALTLSLVAVEPGLGEVQEEILGHVAFSPLTIGGQSRGWFALGPVSVRRDRQSAGIGSALINAGLDRLRAADAQGCVLTGDAGYYSRFGFASHPLIYCEGVPAQYVLRLAFREPAPVGRVEFHPAFFTQTH